jgi:hypothetical protein
MNGVCVRFRGWLDLERLDGIGRLEYDERRGAYEDAILKEQLERYSQRLKDFEDTKPRTATNNNNNNSTNNNNANRGSFRQ